MGKQCTAFISYTTKDRDRIEPYIRAITDNGFGVWVDYLNIKPGQNWKIEISRALDKADFVVIFISNNSIDRTGFVQKEIHIALDKYQERIYGEIYIIPVLLDEIDAIPEQIKSIQCIKSGGGDSISELINAMNFQIQSSSEKSKTIQKSSGLHWNKNSHIESWDGLPGYEIDIEYISIESSKRNNAWEASLHHSSKLFKLLSNERKIKFNQDFHAFDFGQEKYIRSNLIEISTVDPIISGQFLTLYSVINTYYARAAHSNVDFITTNYLVSLGILIESPEHLFKNPVESFQIFRDLVIKNLVGLDADAHVGDGQNRSLEWVESGTKSWDCFKKFAIKDDGIDVIFPPYQVDCYAAGPQFCHVPFDCISNLLIKEYATSLSWR